METNLAHHWWGALGFVTAIALEILCVWNFRMINFHVGKFSWGMTLYLIDINFVEILYPENFQILVLNFEIFSSLYIILVDSKVFFISCQVFVCEECSSSSMISGRSQRFALTWERTSLSTIPSRETIGRLTLKESKELFNGRGPTVSTWIAGIIILQWPWLPYRYIILIVEIRPHQEKHKCPISWC